MRTGAVSRYKQTTEPQNCHDAEASWRAVEGVQVQRFVVHKIESIEPAKTVTSLFALLSVL